MQELEMSKFDQVHFHSKFKKKQLKKKERKGK